jgi:hypothetical protein
MEIYEILLIIGQVLIAVVAWLTRRDQQAFKLRLVEVEQRGAEVSKMSAHPHLHRPSDS